MFIEVIVIYLVLVNLAGFITAGVDKHKAVKGKWRIPEKAFFLLGALGGCIGIYSGIWLFRHKIRKWYFVYGIPLIFILQLFCAYYLYYMTQ